MAILPPPKNGEIGNYEKAEKFGLFNYDPTKSIAYTRQLFNSMALFYDQIYLDWFDYTTLRFIRDEILLREVIFISKEITGGIANYLPSSMLNGIISPFYNGEAEMEALTIGVMKEAKKNNINLIPIYGTLHQFEYLLKMLSYSKFF